MFKSFTFKYLVHFICLFILSPAWAIKIESLEGSTTNVDIYKVDTANNSSCENSAKTLLFRSTLKGGYPINLAANSEQDVCFSVNPATYGHQTVRYTNILHNDADCFMQVKGTGDAVNGEMTARATAACGYTGLCIDKTRYNPIHAACQPTKTLD